MYFQVWLQSLRNIQHPFVMSENDSFNLPNELNQSLDLNLSFDPNYNIDTDVDHNLESSKYSQQKHLTVEHLVEKAVEHYLRHDITLACLEDTLKLMNLTRSCEIELPSTKYLIFKIPKFAYIYRQYHIKCSSCQVYSQGFLAKHNNKCDTCGKVMVPNETNFFIYMPIEKQLIQSIELNWLHIQKYNESFEENHSPHIYDIQNAVLMKKMNEKITGNIISLTTNTDGANKFNSNSISVWPIQIIQNFLPPNIRYKTNNILTVGLYYGRHKPDCLEFFDPLVTEMKKLTKTGLSVIIENEKIQFIPMITHCVVDLPAKRMLQCIKQYNGRNACTYCQHPGCSIRIAKKSKVIRYTSGRFAARSELETLKAMQNITSRSISRNGIMGISCLVSLPNFQIIKGFGIDYMHCVALGVCRKIMNFFLNPKYHNRSFYLKKEQKALLQRRLLSIKPISEIKRKPRPFNDLSDYKANELRSILLYYFPICLIGIIPKMYVNNFQKLSFGIYILLKSVIKNKDLAQAEKNLMEFVHEYEIIYGNREMVMNVHLVSHIVESVKYLGPLWTQSAFPFEKNNGILLKSVRGTTDVLEQMSNKYLLKRSLQKPSIPRIHNMIKFIGRPVYINETLTLYEHNSNKCIKLKNANLLVFKGIKINETKYTSRLYKVSKKSIDFFIGLKCGSFGIVKYYISFDEQKFVVLEEYETLDVIGHILDVESTTMNIYAPVDLIDKKYIYMKIIDKEYISCLPNNYENE